MSEHNELIEEVKALFAEGWCICRSSTLGERVLDALESAGALDVERLETISRLQEEYVKDTDILFLARKAAERALAAALESLPTAPVAGEPEREALADAWEEGADAHANYQGHTPSGMSIDPPLNPYLAAGYRRQPDPREVTTVEELDALPFWSIVKGLNGVARKNHDGWTLDGYIYLRQSDDLEEYLIGPFLVIFTPSTEES